MTSHWTMCSSARCRCCGLAKTYTYMSMTVSFFFFFEISILFWITHFLIAKTITNLLWYSLQVSHGTRLPAYKPLFYFLNPPPHSPYIIYQSSRNVLVYNFSRRTNWAITLFPEWGKQKYRKTTLHYLLK